MREKAQAFNISPETDGQERKRKIAAYAWALALVVMFAFVFSGSTPEARDEKTDSVPSYPGIGMAPTSGTEAYASVPDVGGNGQNKEISDEISIEEELAQSGLNPADFVPVGAGEAYAFDTGMDAHIKKITIPVVDAGIVDLSALDGSSPTLDGNVSWNFMEIPKNPDEFPMTEAIKVFDESLWTLVAEKAAQDPDHFLAGWAKRDLRVDLLKNTLTVWQYIMSVTQTKGDNPKDRGVLDPAGALIEAAAFVYWSKEYNVPLSLAIGVGQTESSFQPNAVSSVGASGPMQVMWSCHHDKLKEIGITEQKQLFSPDRGIQAGCFVLGSYLKSERSIVDALGRYLGKLEGGYASNVFTFRHAYEAHEARIEDDWRSVVAKETKSWEKIGEGVIGTAESREAAWKKNRKTSGGNSGSSASSQPRVPTNPGTMRLIITAANGEQKTQTIRSSQNASQAQPRILIVPSGK